MRYSPTAVYTGAALALGLGAVAGVSLCYRPSLRVGHLRLHEARAVNNPRIEIPALETIIATPTVTATSTMSEPMSEPAVERKKIMRPDYFPQNCNWNDLEYTWQSIKDAKQGRLSDDDVSALICFLEPNEKTELVGDLVEYCRSSDFSAENVSPLVVVKRALFAELSNELIAKDENRYYPSEFSDLLALAAGEMISRGLRVHLQRNDPD
ncbi:MAG TPA: hypothetical protein VJK72_02845, partial [Candidatus Nanoarchaeia archaeon]|nr:hypothetical protein [Candidatus Nanoarchaeia archaeon]